MCPNTVIFYPVLNLKMIKVRKLDFIPENVKSTLAFAFDVLKHSGNGMEVAFPLITHLHFDAVACVWS